MRCYSVSIAQIIINAAAHLITWMGKRIAWPCLFNASVTAAWASSMLCTTWKLYRFQGMLHIFTAQRYPIRGNFEEFVRQVRCSFPHSLHWVKWHYKTAFMEPKHSIDKGLFTSASEFQNFCAVIGEQLKSWRCQIYYMTETIWQDWRLYLFIMGSVGFLSWWPLHATPFCLGFLIEYVMNAPNGNFNADVN